MKQHNTANTERAGHNTINQPSADQTSARSRECTCAIGCREQSSRSVCLDTVRKLAVGADVKEEEGMRSSTVKGDLGHTDTADGVIDEVEFDADEVVFDEDEVKFDADEVVFDADDDVSVGVDDTEDEYAGIDVRWLERRNADALSRATQRSRREVSRATAAASRSRFSASAFSLPLRMRGGSIADAPHGVQAAGAPGAPVEGDIGEIAGGGVDNVTGLLLARSSATMAGPVAVGEVVSLP
jgi:hypothetical protein